MYPFREIFPSDDASKAGLHYMANPPADIIGHLDYEDYARRRGVLELAERGDIDPASLDAEAAADLMGSFFGRLAHAITQPIRSVANVAETAIEVPFQAAERVAMTPFRLLQRGAGYLPGAPRGGGGAPAPGAGPAAPPSADPTQSPDGGGDDSMNADASAGSFWRGVPAHRRHHMRRLIEAQRLPHVMGWQFSDYLPSFLRSKPAGELLVSAVPGGATALEAKNIANKALGDGTLKPEHVSMASKLLKLAHLGHGPSVAKIAKLKQSAGRGDPHAEVALDRLKLVESIQGGRKTGPGTTSSLRHLRNVGLATLHV